MSNEKELKDLSWDELLELTSYEAERDARLRSQSKDAANVNKLSGHASKLGKTWGKINSKHPNFIKAHKELIDRNGQHQLTKEESSRGGNNTWKKRKGTNHMNIMAEKSKEICSKSILCFTKNEEFVKEYKSLKDASIDVGVSKTAIFYCLSGKQKSSAGFIWKYKENNS